MTKFSCVEKLMVLIHRYFKSSLLPYATSLAVSKQQRGWSVKLIYFVVANQKYLEGVNGS